MEFRDKRDSPLSRRIDLELGISVHPDSQGQAYLTKSSEKLTLKEYVMFSTGAQTVTISDQKYKKIRDDISEINDGRAVVRYLTYERR